MQNENNVAEPEESVPEWTDADRAVAEAQGWDIFETSRGHPSAEEIVNGKPYGYRPYELQRDDEANLLSSDEDAWLLVRRNAQAGDERRTGVTDAQPGDHPLESSRQDGRIGMNRQELMREIEGKSRKEQSRLHREYYGQFVTSAVIGLVQRRFGARLLESTDPHFNDIPLSQWDALEPSIKYLCLSHMGDVNGYLWKDPYGRRSILWSRSDAVCIAKEAARQIVERTTQEDSCPTAQALPRGGARAYPSDAPA